jgi:hypothetical protein
MLTLKQRGKVQIIGKKGWALATSWSDHSSQVKSPR